MKYKNLKNENILVFVMGVLFFVVFLIMPVVFSGSNINIGYSLNYSAGIFYGVRGTDLAQDIIGFRAMIADENAYPNLTLAHAKLGLDFPVDAKSTHLPTTFLFVAPVAFLTWRYASMSWAVLMLLGIICTYKVLGFVWPRAIGYGLLSIIWLPVMMSFGQLTILWLLFTILAYKTRNKNPFASGFFIGIASLIKLFPAVMMFPFLLQKKWNAVYGFLLAWGIGAVSVLLISHKAIYEYMNLQQNIQSIILRSDNSSLFNVAYQHFGARGLFITTFLLGIFLLLNRKQLFISGETIQERSWMVWTFLSVALLPVIWIYSLVPLLPIVLNLIRSKYIGSKIIALGSVIIPLWTFPWGDTSVPFVAGVTLLIGIGVTINNSPYIDSM